MKDKSFEPDAVLGARWIRLTQGRWALVDESDFNSLNQRPWNYHSTGYALRRLFKDKKIYIELY
jgi:hypothetical protein